MSWNFRETSNAIFVFVCLDWILFMFFSFSLFLFDTAISLSLCLFRLRCLLSRRMLEIAFNNDDNKNNWKRVDVCFLIAFCWLRFVYIFPLLRARAFVYVLTFYFCVCLILSSLPSLSICMFLDMEEFLFIVTKKHVVRPHLAYSLERSFHSIHIHTIFDNDA